MIEERKCCQHRTKERPEAEYKDLIHRLNRIESVGVLKCEAVRVGYDSGLAASRTVIQ